MDIVFEWNHWNCKSCRTYAELSSWTVQKLRVYQNNTLEWITPIANTSCIHFQRIVLFVRFEDTVYKFDHEQQRNGYHSLVDREPWPDVHFFRSKWQRFASCCWQNKGKFLKMPVQVLRNAHNNGMILKLNSPRWWASFHRKWHGYAAIRNWISSMCQAFMSY